MSDSIESTTNAAPLMSDALIEHGLDRFNDTARPYPADGLIHEIFGAQALRSPDAVAIKDGDGQVSYAELERRANKVAHALIASGVRPDDRVGLYAERSAESIIGMLGILKSGGVYLPLDPNYPPERLSFMVSDSSPVALLATPELFQPASRLGMPTISLSDTLSRPDTMPSVHGLTSRNLAYVIYTSGSTGVPKGVMIEHRSVLRLVINPAYARIGPSDRVPHCASPVFDATTWEIWAPLLNGATIVVIPQSVLLDPVAFNQALVDYAVTAMWLTAGLFHEYIDALEHAFGGLRCLITGGDVVNPAIAARLLARQKRPRQLINGYGPTETTTFATMFVMEAPPSGSDMGSLPLGRPLANTSLYVLDANQQPVPIGGVGEIYIGGPGVARGYLNQPQMTAERFVRDSFSPDADARMYRTGDLGRWRADGNLEFLGRNDDQVKIRGFRIELGEIAARLSEHELVKEAVVVAREDTPGNKRLVAYITAAGERRPDPRILSLHLGGVLPAYMLPAAFVVLERLPLTQNGKLDRRALPSPAADDFAKCEYAAPQGRVEEIVADIWRPLLNTDRIGRNDNFFELGGHSLLLVRLAEQLRSQGLSADVFKVYRAPSLGGFAATLIPYIDSSTPQIPPNRIPVGCDSISPEMLSLIELEPDSIARIVRTVPGGAANVQDIYPLSPLQEGMLFHHRLRAGGSDPYVVANLLAVASLERLNDVIQAFQILINRHDVLRTAILWEDLQNPVQVVYRSAPLRVEKIVLDSTRDVREQLDEWMAVERQSMDIGRAPLVRMRVVADPRSDQWYAIVQVHHVTIDHQSLEILLREATTCLQGRASTLAEPLPYRSHVAWTRALALAQSDDAEAFFRGKLGDVDETTAPFGLLDARGDGSRLDQFRAAVDLSLGERVRIQARRLRMSPAPLFHVAWALVVAQTSGRDDVVFGTVLLGRTQALASIERAFGMFINTLPMRVVLRDLTVRELVEVTQRELVDLLPHEQVSLSVAQRCSAVSGTAPLFTTLINYAHNTIGIDTEDFSMGEGVHLVDQREWTNFPIAVTVEDKSDGFLVIAQTDRRVDPRRIATYLLTAMESLVSALENEPQTLALGLAVVPAPEREEILRRFNATERAYPHEQRVHERFEEMARATPNAVAVTYESEELTYSELNARANQLARYLRNRGVQPGEYVVVLMERSLAQVLAQLATLKCGAVYVPVDPKQPTERQAFMVEDCGARRVMVDDLRAVQIATGNLHWISYPVALESASTLSGVDLPSDQAAQSPAYVMYTSGSTGTPKGVIVPQHAVVRLVINNGYAEISGDDCIAYCSNPTFDASTFEVWGALLNGARLVIVPQSVVLEPARFAEMLQRNAVTIMWLTVGLFTQYADALTGVFARLRYLITGGDVVDPTVVRRVLANGSPQHLLNAYGPTECTTFSTMFEITPLDAGVTSLPIGRPIGNAAIYILNCAMQPVPTGAAGEIYIGGAGVALVYLNRPELTAQKFLPDMFASTPGARLYKTGDLGRWREDGNVEFLGRNDQQVKVRGFRIELGEIESRITRHSDVQEAVVIARAEEAGQKRLIAYVVARSGAVLSAEQIRDYLTPSLPEYMVPSAFVLLPRLPLTANGKLDRRALPSPELEAFASRRYEPPVGEIEEIVAAIWCELLRLERIGRQDHFFELGGYSLLAMQVMVRIRSRLSLELAVSELYDNPLLDKFAARVAEQREELLLERLDTGGAEVDALLEQVASMSEHEMDTLMEQLRAGGRL